MTNKPKKPFINEPINQFINKLLNHHGITMKDVIEKGGITVKDGRDWMVYAARTTIEITPAGRECNKDKITITEKSPIDGWVIRRMTFMDSPFGNVPKGRFFAMSLDSIFGYDVNAIGRKCKVVNDFGKKYTSAEFTKRLIHDDIDGESDIWAMNLLKTDINDNKIKHGICTFKDGTPCKHD